ncbi:hypothetical protein BDV32DRAFT_153033 [Aspergillus pseudonomiae]|uniref:Uncharacterized protein n=1 Tax=Aspergillus pseudonomiae TaxID=1506151 RepID=A0A5N7D332_9EURO|nr:uncharacterized protein BDV37DRAFT_286384 [Aspergillus pseudonomiae]KAB8256757.1 hypothetical protein BDV32DRAFT_153033 [Aspergillus pseudonomiae]KAE8400639.1 hypothetical protein BDV37DRAFT_286384 [Aspergillus pseudonomiae]
MPGFVTPIFVRTDSLKYDGVACFAATLLENLHRDHEVLVFLGISAENVISLASDSHRPLKSVKLSHNFLTWLLTVKMPGFGHEITKSLYKAIVDKQLFATGVSY